jgi:ElaB/YqjD/DUF883 family membrane-anchored ribosome-binding protein
MNDLYRTPETPIETGLGDRFTRTAGRAIEATRSGANHALDLAADQADQLRRHAAPIVDKAAEQATALADRGVGLLRESSQMLRDRAHHARESTASYVSQSPMKSLMFAAAVGAALAWMFSARPVRR